MSVETQFYESPRPPRTTRDRWFLVERDDGSMHVLHRWDYPEMTNVIFTGSGESRVSITNFLRSEESDSAKLFLRLLLKKKGQEHA